MVISFEENYGFEFSKNIMDLSFEKKIMDLSFEKTYI